MPEGLDGTRRLTMDGVMADLGIPEGLDDSAVLTTDSGMDSLVALLSTTSLRLSVEGEDTLCEGLTSLSVYGSLQRKDGM